MGRVLAERLGWEFVDTDDLVESRAGKSIAAIFADDGEAAFRDLEERLVGEASQRERTVVALGGGAVLRDATRRRLAAAGPVVWLMAPAAVLAERIAADAGSASRRPSLTGLAGLEEVQRLLAEREPIYARCATARVDAAGEPPEALADAILARLGGPGAA